MKWLFCLTLALCVLPINTHAAGKCLHVMSYHKGYAWNDGIEKSVAQTLEGHCELKKFYMDTKRNSDSAFARKKADAVSQLILEFKPDIVISSDDNAAKYVVMNYKDARLPFVFCGVNWTAEAYGFPYSNVTGMVEVAPISPMLEIIRKNVDHVRHGVYLSADVITEHKDFEHFQKVYSKKGVQLTGKFVKTMSEWVSVYVDSQSADFVIVNNNAGINDWDTAVALQTVNTKSRKFSVTNYAWMMPYAMIGLTKSAEEKVY
ncbi:hypothetical protein JYT81_00240 [Gammaproteobacteria bacterium AH-315-K14]|nr:hypothetical protein [Gammaproteobacteria bacterium AH-315-K14]